MRTCPAPEILAEWHRGRIGPESATAIADHVRDCPACRTTLDGLRGADGDGDGTTARLGFEATGADVDDRDRTTDHAPAGSQTATFRTVDDPAEAETATSGPPGDPDATASLTPGAPGGHGDSTQARTPGPRGEVVRRAEVPGYRLLAPLGRGGMGVVYRAVQVRLNREVALKMIGSGAHADAEQVGRFLAEAEAVAALRHPNILQVFDVGEVDGLPFLAMELLEGGSLARKLAGTPQPAREAAELVATLARAVHAAHRAGVVHRDLKPANIMFDAEGNPKVVDFGLAKRLESESGRTQTGQVMGSPSYMSPEQAAGRAREVGPAADVYALGAILYECLTGRPPFRGVTPMETVRLVLSDEPVPPRRLRPGVPADLETIALKCLEKAPGRRYESAEALADDLGRYLSGMPILARPTPAWERAAKWARRRPTAAALLVLGVLAASGVAGAGAWYNARQARARAEEERRIEALWGEGSRALLDARARVAAGDPASVEPALKALEVRLDGRPRLAGLRADVGQLLGEIGRARDEEKARAADRAQYEAFLRLRDRALYLDAGLLLDERANRAEVRRLAREAADLHAGTEPRAGALSAEERDDLRAGRRELLVVLAGALARPLPGEDPAAQSRAALAVLAEAAGLGPATLADHRLRARCLAQSGDAEAALAAGREALSARPETASDFFLAAQERYHGRDWPEAIRLLESALARRRDHFWVQALLAIALLQEARPGEARVHLNALVRAQPGLPWPYLLRAYAAGEQALLVPAQADDLFAAAEADYDAALALGPDDDDRYILLVNRGLLWYRRGRPGLAVADLSAAAALKPEQFQAYVTLAQLARERRDHDEAIRHLDRAIELKPDLARLFRDRAWALAARRDPSGSALEAALADLDEALRLEPAGNAATRAGDHARRARLLGRARRYEEALAACEQALKLAPGHAEARLLRLDALLGLDRLGPLREAADALIGAGDAPAEAFVVRALARLRTKDYPGAVEDYGRALFLEPMRADLLAQRGWAYLFAEAPAMAMADFDAALWVDPGLGTAYAGRGYVLAGRGQHREAARDARLALERLGYDPATGAPTAKANDRPPQERARDLYNVARIYARSLEAEFRDLARLADPALSPYYDTLRRAERLLARAVAELPAGQRAGFWRSVVLTDPALEPLRRRPDFAATTRSILGRATADSAH